MIYLDHHPSNQIPWLRCFLEVASQRGEPKIAFSLPPTTSPSLAYKSFNYIVNIRVSACDRFLMASIPPLIAFNDIHYNWAEMPKFVACSRHSLFVIFNLFLLIFKSKKYH